MTIKILIVDDDESIYERIITLFDQINEQTDNSYKYMPDNLKDFRKIRSKFNSMNSPREDMRDSASEYLTDLTHGVDLLLLDYQLLEHGGIRTGLDLYKELQLEKKAIIYTKSTSREIEDIKRNISSSRLNERIYVLQKPYVYDSDAASILRNNIEKMLQ